MQYQVYSWKVEMSPDKYLELWLSEQIPIKDWLKLLDANPAIEKVYKNHIEGKKRRN